MPGSDRVQRSAVTTRRGRPSRRNNLREWRRLPTRWGRSRQRTGRTWPHRAATKAAPSCSLPAVPAVRPVWASPSASCCFVGLRLCPPSRPSGRRGPPSVRSGSPVRGSRGLRCGRSRRPWSPASCPRPWPVSALLSLSPEISWWAARDSNPAPLGLKRNLVAVVPLHRVAPSYVAAGHRQCSTSRGEAVTTTCNKLQANCWDAAGAVHRSTEGGQVSGAAAAVKRHDRGSVGSTRTRSSARWTVRMLHPISRRPARVWTVQGD